MAPDAPNFDRDIRPLFRDEDVDAMDFAFDLSSYDDVKENAEEIYERVDEGSMPCDRAWPAERVQLFRSWIDGGMSP
jgi:hypothetical protein